ncbi:MAG: cellulase family glycosylhydrolase [Bacilli bacterium]
MEKWSKEKAWAWYNQQNWIRGFCYYPSCCVDLIEMWQEYNWDNVKKTINHEMKLAKDWGFNAVRIITSFEVYLDQHDAMMEHLEEFIMICDQHQIKVMVCLGNDCLVSKSNYKKPIYGEQKCEYFYHSGKAISPHIVMNDFGYSLTDDEENVEKYLAYIDEIVGKYAKDKRVLLWDIFNEPGNSKRDMLSYEIMKKSFEIARKHQTIQPCAACCWSYDKHNRPYKEIELKALEMSDVILYHGYMDFKKHHRTVRWLKKTYDRPLFNTEWLHRIWHNNVKNLFPYFRKHKIACFNWGLVRGKSQTNEPWEWLFNVYHQGHGKDWDFTKWQHDLIRSNGQPYDFEEEKIIKRECQKADSIKK